MLRRWGLGARGGVERGERKEIAQMPTRDGHGATVRLFSVRDATLDAPDVFRFSSTI